MAGGPPGATLRLIRDCGEIERLIATLDSRAEAVEMTETATHKAEEDCNNLDFFSWPDTSFAIILYPGLATQVVYPGEG